MARACSGPGDALKRVLLASWLVLGCASARSQAQATTAPAAGAQQSERITCSIAAAIKHSIPANVVLAVAEVEGGKPGQWVSNRNGTYDVGPMQLNTSYLRELARYGITAEDVAAAGCYAYDLATWRLARHLARDRGDLWQRAANYHSRTQHINARYRAKLMARGARWASWLKARYATREFTAPAVPAVAPPLAAMPAQTASAPRRPLPAAKRRVVRPAAAAPARAGWVQNSEVHLSPDELRALHTGRTLR